MVGGKLQRLIYLNGFIWPEYLPDKPRRSEGCNNLIENPPNWPIFAKILGAIVVKLFKELVDYSFLPKKVLVNKIVDQKKIALKLFRLI